MKLLFTGQVLAYFLQFFMSPLDAAAAYDETMQSIKTGLRANGNKMADGMKGLVIDGLQGRPLKLFALIHRLEINWVEHKLPTLGEIEPVVSKASERRPQSGGNLRDRTTAGDDGAPDGLHQLVIRFDELTFEWEAPPPNALKKGPIFEPRQQAFVAQAKSSQCVMMPPTIMPSTWLERADVVDRVVAAVGWNVAPIPELYCRFIFTLDKLPPTSKSNGSLFHTRFRLDFGAKEGIAFHLREGHALTASALTMSLLRGLAPLLNMLDSTCKWPLTGDGKSGWFNVTEAKGTGALQAARRAAAGGSNLPHVRRESGSTADANAAASPPRRRTSFDSGAQLRSWGGCWVTIGAGMLQYAAVDGERRSIVLDSWELVSTTASSTALILHLADGPLSRALTLHCESRFWQSNGIPH